MRQGARHLSRQSNPARSPAAAKAYAAGEVRWVLDLSKPPGQEFARAITRRTNRAVVAFTAVAAIVWIYDVWTVLSQLPQA